MMLDFELEGNLIAQATWQCHQCVSHHRSMPEYQERSTAECISLQCFSSICKLDTPAEELHSWLIQYIGPWANNRQRPWKGFQVVTCTCVACKLHSPKGQHSLKGEPFSEDIIDTTIGLWNGLILRGITFGCDVVKEGPVLYTSLKHWNSMVMRSEGKGSRYYCKPNVYGNAIFNRFKGIGRLADMACNYWDAVHAADWSSMGHDMLKSFDEAVKFFQKFDLVGPDDHRGPHGGRLCMCWKIRHAQCTYHGGLHQINQRRRLRPYAVDESNPR